MSRWEKWANSIAEGMRTQTRKAYGGYWFISAIALRIGASETLSIPAKG